jgi:hypothetical protein
MTTRNTYRAKNLAEAAPSASATPDSVWRERS